MAHAVTGLCGLDSFRQSLDDAFLGSEQSPGGNLSDDVLALRRSVGFFVYGASKCVYKLPLGKNTTVLRLAEPGELSGAQQLDASSCDGRIVAGKAMYFPELDESRPEWLRAHMLLEVLGDTPLNGHKPLVFAVAVGRTAFDMLAINTIGSGEQVLGTAALSELAELPNDVSSVDHDAGVAPISPAVSLQPINTTA